MTPLPIHGHTNMHVAGPPIVLYDAGNMSDACTWEDADVDRGFVGSPHRCELIPIIDAGVYVISAFLTSQPHPSPPRPTGVERAIDAILSLPTGCLCINSVVDAGIDHRWITLSPGTYDIRIHQQAVSNTRARFTVTIRQPSAEAADVLRRA